MCRSDLRLKFTHKTILWCLFLWKRERECESTPDIGVGKIFQSVATSKLSKHITKHLQTHVWTLRHVLSELGADGAIILARAAPRSPRKSKGWATMFLFILAAALLPAALSAPLADCDALTRQVQIQGRDQVRCFAPWGNKLRARDASTVCCSSWACGRTWRKVPTWQDLKPSPRCLWTTCGGKSIRPMRVIPSLCFKSKKCTVNVADVWVYIFNNLTSTVNMFYCERLCCCCKGWAVASVSLRSWP